MLFPLHLNTYVMGLRSLGIFEAYSAGTDFRRQKVGPRAVWVKHKTRKRERQREQLIFFVLCEKGGGPRGVVSTAAFHARIWGSVPGLGGLKETKNVSSPSTCESQYSVSVQCRTQHSTDGTNP